MVAIRGGCRRSSARVIPSADRGRETLYLRRAPSTRRASPFKRRWSSSRPTRSRSSPKRPCTTESIPALPESAIRSWSTSKPRYSRMADAPGQSVLEDGVYVPAGTSQRFVRAMQPAVVHAPRRGWPDRRSRRAHADDSTGVTAGTPPSRSRLSLPRLRAAVRPGPSPSRHGRTAAPPHSRIWHCFVVRHHRAVHEEGYQVERQADGELRFRRPDGRPLPDTPPPGAVPADPVGALRAGNDGHELHLHARTAMPGWLGERLDVATRSTSAPTGRYQPRRRRLRGAATS